MELTFRRPDVAAHIPEDERARLLRENSELCIVEEKRFFLRALLPLPVESREDDYCIGLWVEVTQDAFERIYDIWDLQEKVSEPPFTVQIANEIPTVPGSLGLEAELHLNPPGARPYVFIRPGTHQLYIEQAEGIDQHRISEYTALFG
jgi:hypothetical protein